MKIGVLKPYKEEEHKEDLAQGKLTIGVDAAALLDEITLLEVQTEYNLPRVLSEVKMNLMLAVGRATVQNPEGKDGESNQEVRPQ